MAAGAARRAGGVRGGGTESTLDAADEGSKPCRGGAAERRHENNPREQYETSAARR